MEQISWPFVIIVLILGVVAAIVWIWIWRQSLPIGLREIESASCSHVGKSAAFKDNKIAVSTRKSVVISCRFFYTVISLVYIALLLEPFWFISLVGIPLFGFLAVISWRSDWIEANANAEGIEIKIAFGTFSAKLGRKKFVPWSEITSCEVVTTHNVYGKFIRRSPILKDTKGRIVFDGSRSKASQEDLDRLINFIRGT